MPILVAKTAGFCFGVDRAVQMVYDLLEEGRKVYTLGPIIHNPQMVDELRERGVVTVEDICCVPRDATLVIRSHGVARQVTDQLLENGVEYRDATCPFVSKIHKIVAQYSGEGYPILIAGDQRHPEVEGIRGHCGDSYVFENAEELRKISEDFVDIPVCVVSQTTFSKCEWEKCEEILKNHYTNPIVFDTICSATSKRQEEALVLAQRCDLMIIIGGRQSSNTQKLFSLCSSRCPTYHIQTADELPRDVIAASHCVGVTAGASTPARIIKEVLNTMTEIMNEENLETPIETPVEAAAEAVEAVEEKSFDEMTFEEALEQSLKSLNTDEKVYGIVVGIAPNEIQVDVGRKQAGYVPLSELSNDPNAKAEDLVKIGDKLELLIMRTNDQEGTIMLSKRRVDAIRGWEVIVEAEESGAILEGKVTDVINGGVLAVTNGVRVFIPASLTGVPREGNLEELKNTEVKFRIIETNKNRRRAVGSIKSVLKDARKEKADAFWAQAEIGQVYSGTVKSLTSYGAFVDIGGVDGMIHISELSWSRIKHPSEVVNVGDQVEVSIKDLDPEKRKVSLGYKKTEDNPWEILKRDYAVDQVVTVKIASLTTFGAFASIIPGIDGLIHISQIANARINKPADVLKVGQEVQAKITAIDFDNKRVSLSMRALLSDEDAAMDTEAPVEVAPVEEAPAEEPAAEE